MKHIPVFFTSDASTLQSGALDRLKEQNPLRHPEFCRRARPRLRTDSLPVCRFVPLSMDPLFPPATSTRYTVQREQFLEHGWGPLQRRSTY